MGLDRVECHLLAEYIQREAGLPDEMVSAIIAGKLFFVEEKGGGGGGGGGGGVGGGISGRRMLGGVRCEV